MIVNTKNTTHKRNTSNEVSYYLNKETQGTASENVLIEEFDDDHEKYERRDESKHHQLPVGTIDPAESAVLRFLLPDLGGKTTADFLAQIRMLLEMPATGCLFVPVTLDKAENTAVPVFVSITVALIETIDAISHIMIPFPPQK
jgi:hypothetical protein